jgi:hypothetical protein
MRSYHNKNRQRVKFVCIAEFKKIVQIKIPTHLEVRAQSLAVSYLAWCLTRWRFDHFLPKLPNCIKDLVEIARYSLYGSSKGVVHNSEPLVMDDNMNKYNNLLFHTGVDAILQQSSIPKPLD